MCLSCQYNRFWKCVCNDNVCIEYSYRHSRLCEQCYGSLSGYNQYMNLRCRKCGSIFESRNSLFRHLKDSSHFT